MENKLTGASIKSDKSLTNMTDNAMWKNSMRNLEDQG